MKNQKQTCKTTRACEEFIAAHETYKDGIFRFCLSKTSNRERALDITQETFMRAWKYRREHPIHAWKPFLFRTAYNLIVSSYRKKRSESLDYIIDECGFMPSDAGEIGAEKQAEYERAKRAFRSLESTYREPLSLRFVDGLSPKEIASTMHLSENVVSVRIHRGLEKLRTALHAPSPESTS